jgi:hypothetical protein
MDLMACGDLKRPSCVGLGQVVELLRRNCRTAGIQGMKTMKRPTGVTLIAVLLAGVAAMLALSCVASFCIAFVVITGGISRDPISTAITGMAIGGGCSLIMLASAAACVAISLFELREWAWSASIAAIGLCTAFGIVGIYSFRRFFLMPIGMSLLCHLAVVGMAAWMLHYLLQPGVRRAFSAASV